MTNLIDYIKWRGDLSFEQDPFNEIDALLFASMCYVDLEGIVPESGEITLMDAADIYYQIHSREELESDKTFFRFSHQLLKEAASVRRYKFLTLSHYINHTDPASLVQFAVVTVRLSPDEVFIAFRGTDDTIVGWKEDFYLSYFTVPSEDEAVEYLTAIESGRSDRIMMGGHSKGGHLAIHAAMTVDEEIQNRVDAIFDFDGPGFNDEIRETKGFMKIAPTIHRYIPENSIIGRLLSDTAVPNIVFSCEKGVLQHDPVSWGIEGKRFMLLEKPSIASDVFDETLTSWLKAMSQEEKKQFIDDLFAVLEASGETKVTEIPKVNLFEVKAMLDKMHSLRRDSQRGIRNLIRLFIDNWGEVLAAQKSLSEPKTPLGFLISSKRKQDTVKGDAT